MRDLDRILDEAADAGRRAATPLPPGQIRGVAGRLRRARVITAATMSTASVVAVVALVTTAGIPTSSPEPIQSSPASEPTTTTQAPTSPPPTTAPTTPASPPPTSAQPDQGPILDGRLLPVDTVAQSTGGAGAESPWVADDGATEARCDPEPGGLTTETAHVRYVADRLGFDQWAEAYPTAAAAAGRLAGLRALVIDCAEQTREDVDLLEAYTLRGVGDVGFVAVMEQPLNENEQLYLELAASATGRVVTWTISTGPGQDHVRIPRTREIAAATDLLCGAAGGMCSDYPVLDQTDPEVIEGLTAGFLTTDDVGGVLSGSWSDYLEPFGQLPFGCTTPDPEATVTASYRSLDAERGLSIGQTVLILGSEPAAVAALDTVVGCLSGDPEYSVLDGVALAWQSSSGTVLAVRQDGPRVTVLLASDDGPGVPPVEPATLQALVSRVEARLAEAG